MSAFDDAFAAADRTAERVMGEDFVFGGRAFPAISVEPVTHEQRAMSGGKFNDASTVVYVRAGVFAEAGIQINQAIRARGQDLRVIQIEHDATGSRVLICGPAGIRMPQRL